MSSRHQVAGLSAQVFRHIQSPMGVQVQDLQHGWEKCQAATSEEEARHLAEEWPEEFRMRQGSAALMAAAQEGCDSPGNSKWESG